MIAGGLAARDLHAFRPDADGQFVLRMLLVDNHRIQLLRKIQEGVVVAKDDPGAAFAGPYHAPGHVHDRTADELRDEQVGGMAVHLGRRADLLQHPVVHDRDLVRHRHGLDLVVGHIHGGRFVLDVQALEFGAHLFAQLRIQRADRLIHQQRLGTAHQRTPDGHALQVAAGQRARPLLEQVLDLQRLRGIHDALVDGLRGFAGRTQRESDVLVRGQVRIKCVELEHESDVAVGGLQRLHRLAVDQDVAGIDVLESGDGAQGRRLAATGRTQQHHEFAVADLQVELADDVAFAEVFFDVP